MRRADLEHVLRAAATVAGVTDLVVLGSQAILGSYPEWDLPIEATMSIEADVAIDVELAHLDREADETALADLIDGAMGEGSMFQQTHGYYAQGVETSTAVLTDGWRDRLVPMICESADPKVGGVVPRGPRSLGHQGGRGARQGRRVLPSPCESRSRRTSDV